jgi:hypothetical protein
MCITNYIRKNWTNKLYIFKVIEKAGSQLKTFVLIFIFEKVVKI